MDSFDYKKYLREGRIHQNDDTLITEAEVSEKKDKQGYKDRENESDAERLGSDKDPAGVGSKKHKEKDERDLSYGKFGKRDAEKKGENKVNKEGVDEVEKGYFKKEHGVGETSKKDELKETIESAYSRIKEGAYPFDECLDDNVGKYGEEGAKKVCGAIKAAYGEGLVREDESPENINKLTVSELKAKIREEILGTLSEAEEDVDVDVDFEDEVDVDVEGDDIEIERPAVKAKVNVGLSPEEEIVQDSLKAAMDAADALGNDKLADQIGNTITFFTREYVVGRNSD